jgi:hypothetical protein
MNSSSKILPFCRPAVLCKVAYASVTHKQFGLCFLFGGDRHCQGQ